MKRRIVYWLLAGVAVGFVATHTKELAQLWQVMRGGDWRWLLVAAALQAGYYGFYIWTYQAAFAAVGIKRSYRELVPPVLGTFFVNAVTPTAGTAGTALVVGDSVRRGNKVAASTAAWVLAQAVDFVSFAIIMVGGFIYLALSGHLKTYELVAAAVLLGIIGLFMGMFVFAALRPTAVTRILGWVQRRVAAMARTIRRPSPIGDNWAQRTGGEFTRSSRLLVEHPRGVVRAAALSLAGYVLDVLSMIAVGYAFGWDRPGSLLAAYAVGVLVWLTSIVPQGIGVVEGAIAVVLASFGATIPQATAISLVFRGMSFWLPMFLGFLLLRRVSTFKSERRSASAETFASRAAAMLTATVGVIDVLSAVTPGIRARVALLERILPLHIEYGHLAAALAGIGLVFLSRGLWRRKRMAWGLTLALLALSVVSHLAKGLDYEEAIIASALLVWLLTQYRAFYARPDVPSLGHGLAVLGAAATSTLAYGTVGFYLLDRHFSMNFGFWAAVRQTVVMFTQFYDPHLQPITRFGRYFADSIYAVGAITLGYALLVAMRPVFVRKPASQAERARATAIVQAWGRSSIAATTLLPDKTYFFSPGGSVIAYVALNGYALALGDPVGPDEDFPAAIAGFSEICGGNGWVPIFYQTLPDHVAEYHAAGLRAIRVGHEAIVDVSAFSLAGGSHKSVRNRIHRVEEDGYRAVLHEPPIPEDLMRELESVSEGWLTMIHGSEKRYSLGWFLPEYVAACPIMAVHAPDGRVIAFANVISEYRRPERSIDLMRHLPEAPSGTMDYMFVRLFEWCRAQQDCATFNLGLSSLADIGDKPQDPTVEKVLHLIYRYVNQFYGFQGLHAYKEKFDPTWEPRFLVYPPATDLLRVFYALVSADAGENVIVSYLRPFLWRGRRP